MTAVERFGLSAEVQDAVWALWRTGISLRAVARELGVSREAVARYVRWCGGRQPVARRRSPRCLSFAEREEVSRGLARGDSFRQIASSVGRSHSTICREVGRNGGRLRYRAERADRSTWDRARRPKVARLASHAPLRETVEEKLRLRWSPQQISAWLRRTYPDDAQMQLSHETIYLSLFVQTRGALHKELAQHLRTGRITRVPRGQRAPTGRGEMNDLVLISERPAEVDDRAVPGHWEGDLLMGNRPTAIATLVERSTRYVQLVLLPDGFRATPVRDAVGQSVQRLPAHLRKSLTWDQGKEMAEHLQFTVDTGVQVYFCDPRSPWQRGSNENTNGLLRQYFPKRRFSFAGVTQDDLDVVAAELNGRPRQTLGWDSPAERFAALIPAQGTAD